MNETMVSGGDNSNSDEWKDFDFSTVKVEKPRVTRALPKREAVRFVMVGLFSGVAVWAVRLMLDNWVMWPLFCRTPDTASVCTNAGVISFIIALVVVGIIAATILTSQRVWRGIVVTAATFVSVGALWPLLNTRGTIMAMVLTAAFTTGLYLLFALMASVKRSTIAAGLLTALTVAFWLLVRA